MKDRLVFIHSISQRCGHNLLANLIRTELPVNHIYGKNYEVMGGQILSRSWVWNNKNKDFVRSKDARNAELEFLIEGYRQKILQDLGSTLLKNPSLQDPSQVQIFPKDKHLVLLRNPYDLFVSVEKSIYNFRIKTFKTKIKKIFRPIYSFVTTQVVI